MGSAWFTSLQGHPASHRAVWSRPVAWSTQTLEKGPIPLGPGLAALGRFCPRPVHGKWWQEEPDPASHGQDLGCVWSRCPLKVWPHPLPSACQSHGPLPIVSQGQHFPPRGHWTRPPGSCPKEGVCWVAPVHPTSLGASGQGWPRVPGPLSRALLNSRHEIGGGQCLRHCLTSELWGLGNSHSWTGWGGHIWGRHGLGCSLPAAPPAL